MRELLTISYQKKKMKEDIKNHTIHGYLVGNRVAKFKGLDWVHFDGAQYIGSSQCPITKKTYHHWHAWIVKTKRYTTVITQTALN